MFFLSSSGSTRPARQPGKRAEPRPRSHRPLISVNVGNDLKWDAKCASHGGFLASASGDRYRLRCGGGFASNPSERGRSLLIRDRTLGFEASPPGSSADSPHVSGEHPRPIWRPHRRPILGQEIQATPRQAAVQEHFPYTRKSVRRSGRAGRGTPARGRSRLRSRSRRQGRARRGSGERRFRGGRGRHGSRQLMAIEPGCWAISTSRNERSTTLSTLF